MSIKNTTPLNITKLPKYTKMAILVATLGYFVDIYDLILFTVIRIPSLQAIGITSPTGLSHYGEILLSIQMFGMLIGGIFWGVLGDKKGRISILLGSIILYSLANLLNAFIVNIEQYMILRFIAGIGLAGELGAGITLVSELVPKEKRGYMTSLVAGIGITGAIAAFLVSQYTTWRVAYAIGGIMGFLLLTLRIGVIESGMYSKVQVDIKTSKGNFFLFFNSRARFIKYIQCILIGVPLWYLASIPMAFANSFGEALKSTSALSPAYAVFFLYSGLSIGDVLAGSISQWLKSRKKVIATYLILNMITLGIFFTSYEKTSTYYYTLYFILGIINGYWALFVTVGAEQFGTNLRATAATTIPNFVRGVVPLLLLLLNLLKTFFASYNFNPSQTLIYGAATLGLTTCLLALLACSFMPETYHKDLDYTE